MDKALENGADYYVSVVAGATFIPRIVPTSLAALEAKGQRCVPILKHASHPKCFQSCTWVLSIGSPALVMSSSQVICGPHRKESAKLAETSPTVGSL